jgi:hypothetical protein
MKILYATFAVMTSMVGHTMHGSIFFAIMDFLFTPFVWVKWIVLKQINLTIIENTFPWFFS